MIDSLKGRIIISMLIVTIVNLLLFLIVGESVCNWVNYLFLIGIYPSLIYLNIRDHIENEVIKEVHKISRELGIR